jgi:hypothetical protein
MTTVTTTYLANRTGSACTVDYRLHQVGQIKALMSALDRLHLHHGFPAAEHVELENALIAEAGLLAQGGPRNVHDAALPLSALPVPSPRAMDLLREERVALARRIEKLALFHVLGGDCWATALATAARLMSDPAARMAATGCIETLAPRTTRFTGWSGQRHSADPVSAAGSIWY